MKTTRRPQGQAKFSNGYQINEETSARCLDREKHENGRMKPPNEIGEIVLLLNESFSFCLLLFERQRERERKRENTMRDDDEQQKDTIRKCERSWLG